MEKIIKLTKRRCGQLSILLIRGYSNFICCLRLRTFGEGGPRNSYDIVTGLWYEEARETLLQIDADIHTHTGVAYVESMFVSI